MTIIKLKNISKAFDEKQVLSNLSIDIAMGKITALMGTSGSGKTTLLRIIAGLETLDSGTITVESDTNANIGVYDIKNNMAAMEHIKIKMMFQEDRLLGHLSAVDNVRFTSPEISHGEIVEALKKIGLGESLDQPVSEFSGGMKRRVALVRALLSECDLLLLDEPFNGLDDDSRMLAISLLKQLKANRTVLFTTHRPDEAQMLAAEIKTL